MNTDRIYQGDDDHWYFNVRGNLPKGPFASYDDAETALEKHVRQCRAPLAAPSFVKALNAESWSRAFKAIKVGRHRVSTPRHS